MTIRFVEVLDKVDQVLISHRGVVVSNNDPARLGRIRVRIPFVLDAEEGLLPWAIPFSSGPGVTRGSRLDVPEVDSVVWIQFLNGDPYLPVYSNLGFHAGSLSSVLTGASDSFSSVSDPSTDSDYPEVYGYVDSQGTYVKVNKKRGFLAFKHGPSGAYICVNREGEISVETFKSGNIFVKHPGNLSVVTGSNSRVEVGGNATVEVKGNVEATVGGFLKVGVGSTTTVESSGDMLLKAPKITLDGPVYGTKTIAAEENISTPADVRAGSISLKEHVHSGVRSGSANTEKPI